MNRKERISAMLREKEEELKRVSAAFEELGKEVPQLKRLADMPEVSWENEGLREELRRLTSEIRRLTEKRERLVAKEDELYNGFNEFIDKRNVIFRLLDQDRKMTANVRAQSLGYSQDQIDAAEKLLEKKLEKLGQNDLLALFGAWHGKAMQKNIECRKVGIEQRGIRDEVFMLGRKQKDIKRILEFNSGD